MKLSDIILVHQNINLILNRSIHWDLLIDLLIGIFIDILNLCSMVHFANSDRFLGMFAACAILCTSLHVFARTTQKQEPPPTSLRKGLLQAQGWLALQPQQNNLEILVHHELWMLLIPYISIFILNH